MLSLNTDIFPSVSLASHPESWSVWRCSSGLGGHLQDAQAEHRGGKREI